MAEREIRWSQLVALMAVGDGPEKSLRGVVRSREAVLVEAGERADVEHPDGDRYRLVENEVRVMRRGGLLRRERMNGEPLSIQGPDLLWVWENGHSEPAAVPRPVGFGRWPESTLVQRRGLDEWSGDDFTRPAAPPVATTFLGRDGWQVVLLPPAHKPFPLRMIVDDETGLVLSERNDGFQTLTEWTALELDVALPDELFAWDGPSHPLPDPRAAHDPDMVDRRAWLTAHGVGSMGVTLPIEVLMHQQAVDGTFLASLTAELHATLARRPHSGKPWDLPVNAAHAHQWTSDGWDWFLETREHVDPAAIESLKRQLNATPR